MTSIRFKDVTGDYRCHNTVFIGDPSGQRIGPLAIVPAPDDGNRSAFSQTFRNSGAETARPAGDDNGFSFHLFTRRRLLFDVNTSNESRVDRLSDERLEFFA